MALRKEFSHAAPVLADPELGFVGTAPPR